VSLTLSPIDVPQGYPHECERRIRLRDGRTVGIRPLIPADAPLLAEPVIMADPETLRRASSAVRRVRPRRWWLG
jgi:hypothetical protein